MIKNQMMKMMMKMRRNTNNKCMVMRKLTSRIQIKTANNKYKLMLLLMSTPQTQVYQITNQTTKYVIFTINNSRLTNKLQI